MTISECKINELLDQVERGSRSAVQQLVSTHRARLRKMVVARMDVRLQSRLDPSDVVQDVLTEASHRLPKFSRDRVLPFYPWLHQIARDRLIELHHQHVTAQKRSINRETVHAVLLGDESITSIINRLPAANASPSDMAARKEMTNTIRTLLGELDEATREVLLMRYVEQMKIREIAAALNLTESAIKSRHVRGLRKLAAAMECEGLD